MRMLKILAVVLLACSLAGGDEPELKILRAENAALRRQVAQAAPTIARLRQEKAALEKALQAARRKLKAAQTALATLRATMATPPDAKRQKLHVALDALAKLIRTAQDGRELRHGAIEASRRLELAAVGLGRLVVPAEMYTRPRGASTEYGLRLSHPSGAAIDFPLQNASGRGLGTLWTSTRLTNQVRADMLGVLQPWYALARKKPRR